jgi:hypothetical protein
LAWSERHLHRHCFSSASAEYSSLSQTKCAVEHWAQLRRTHPSSASASTLKSIDEHAHCAKRNAEIGVPSV